MKKLLIIYRSYSKDSTFGNVYHLVDGHFEILCNSLELPWNNNTPKISCIPEGYYKVVPDSTGKHQYFRVIDVPNRSFIEIHEGNIVSNSQGCILLGTKKQFHNATGYYYLSNSKEACDKLKRLYPDGFNLLITSI